MDRKYFENKYAVLLQRVGRGMVVRVRVRKIRQANASIVIQKQVRKWLAQKLFRKL